MTEVVITHCDFEQGCERYWRKPAAELPMSWVTTRRPVRVGEEIVIQDFHLCSTHRGDRVRGEIGGNRHAVNDCVTVSKGLSS